MTCHQASLRGEPYFPSEDDSPGDWLRGILGGLFFSALAFGAAWVVQLVAFHASVE